MIQLKRWITFSSNLPGITTEHKPQVQFEMKRQPSKKVHPCNPKTTAEGGNYHNMWHIARARLVLFTKCCTHKKHKVKMVNNCLNKLTEFSLVYLMGLPERARRVSTNYYKTVYGTKLWIIHFLLQGEHTQPFQTLISHYGRKAIFVGKTKQLPGTILLWVRHKETARVWLLAVGPNLELDCGVTYTYSWTVR